jgi:hypothetical protein
MKIDPPINPEELKRLYYLCGLTLSMAQQIEYGFKYVLWLLTDRGVIKFDPERATDLMEGRAKLTLGQVLKVLGEHVSFGDEVAEIFKTALDARNRFVHSFLIDHTDEIADPATRDGVITEIKGIRKCMLEGDKVIQVAIAELLRAYGLDFDSFQKQFADEIRAKNPAG